MDKNDWLAFLSSKIKSQISLEAIEKAQNWVLALFGFIALSFAFASMGTANANNAPVISGAKILFLVFFHAYILAAFFIPAVSQKSQRPVSRLLQTRDIQSLIAIASLLAFYCFTSIFLSIQTALGNPDFEPSIFLKTVSWMNAAISGFYFAGILFYLMALKTAPATLIKLIGRGSKAAVAGLTSHAVLISLTGIAYLGQTRLGSPEFFEQLRIAGLFWVFISASILLTGKISRESAVPALSALELDLISGKLERMELVIPRFKEAFIGSRFDLWLKRYARDVAEKAAEIAKYSKEAEALVSVEKPSELDLRQVEDRYRQAEVLYKQIEKNHQRFMTSMVAFYLTETETEKAALVRDQFSRELRNGKLELATIRKRIDERLVSLKNSISRVTSERPQEIEELTAR